MMLRMVGKIYQYYVLSDSNEDLYTLYIKEKIIFLDRILYSRI